MKSEPCKHCGLSCLLARDVAANGKPQYFWWCTGCARVADSSRPFLAKEYIVRVLHENPDTLPVVQRYPQAVNPTCEYAGCRRTDTEYHHWAPRHLFGLDGDNWPTSYLCAEHHPRWHAVVTPDMCKPTNGTRLASPARAKVATND